MPRNCNSLSLLRRIITFTALLLVVTESITLVRAWNSLSSQNAPQRERAEVARLSEQVSVRASRGTPSVNLSDGRELLTSFSGSESTRQALEMNQASPLSLASADFDEDGVPDLVSGYRTDSGGIVTLHSGNVDAIYPNAPEAQQRRAQDRFTDAPFLSPGRA